MNAEWIREAADKAFPDHLVTVAGVTVVGVSRADERSAFIAGVAAGLAKAAEVAEGQDAVDMALAGAHAGNDIAAAIRGLSDG